MKVAGCINFSYNALIVTHLRGASRLQTVFRHLVTHELRYAGDCRLLGVTGDGLVYAEELHGDEDWLAQHKLSGMDGIIESVDEQQGANPNAVPFSLPADITSPVRRPCFAHLNYAGARRRGMASTERIEELVLGIGIADKIELVDFMEWSIDPLQLIGIAESVILACAAIDGGAALVCRRIRVACRLGEARMDEHGFEYNYDTLPVNLLHELAREAGGLPDLADCLQDLDDVALLRPMDCLYHQGKLYVADGGEGDDPSAIHIFKAQKRLETQCTNFGCSSL